MYINSPKYGNYILDSRAGVMYNGSMMRHEIMAIANGSAGYAGSPAQAEDLREQRENRRRIANLVRRCMVGGTIMFRDYRGRRHLKAIADAVTPDRYYVRTGKRGTCRMDITKAKICCEDPLVVEFSGGR